jgi:hypothetical protein
MLPGQAINKLTPKSKRSIILFKRNKQNIHNDDTTKMKTEERKQELAELSSKNKEYLAIII